VDKPEQEQADNNNSKEQEGLSSMMARARIQSDLLVDISKEVLEPIFG
jgi:hypothetical protein